MLEAKRQQILTTGSGAQPNKPTNQPTRPKEFDTAHALLNLPAAPHTSLAD